MPTLAKEARKYSRWLKKQGMPFFQSWSERRKRVTMLVTVSVPENMSARDARREVRNLITYGAGWYFSAGDEIKCIAAKPAKKGA